MKLGLLVVFAVAALLPSLSESRIVSKCELKQELENSIPVLGWLPRWYKERILARVICQVYRMSGLNTEAFRRFPPRRTTTPATATTGSRTTTARPPMPETTRPPFNVSRPPMPETTRPPFNVSRPPMPETTRPPFNVSRPAPPLGTTEGIQTATLDSTSQPNRLDQVSGSMRKKRDAASSSSNESDMTETDSDVVELLSEEEADEQGVDNSNEMEDLELDDDNLESEEELEEEEGDNEEGDEQELEEGGKRKKRSASRWGRRTTSFYGIFQLSDRYFCNSGENRSRNVCRTNCNAFINDDIMDDVRCIARTGYWRRLYRRSRYTCRRIPSNFFGECR